MAESALFSNLLTVAILFTLGIIIYAKMTSKTLVDIIRDIRAAFSDSRDDFVEYTPHGFEAIR